MATGRHYNNVSRKYLTKRDEFAYAFGVPTFGKCEALIKKGLYFTNGMTYWDYDEYSLNALLQNRDDDGVNFVTVIDLREAAFFHKEELDDDTCGLMPAPNVQQLMDAIPDFSMKFYKGAVRIQVSINDDSKMQTTTCTLQQLPDMLVTIILDLYESGYELSSEDLITLPADSELIQGVHTRAKTLAGG